MDNIQLLRRSAEDVNSDARQWAASSGEGDATTDGMEQDATERDDALRTGYRPDSIGMAARLLDVLRNALTGNEVTADSKEISAVLAQLHQFQTGALSSDDELRGIGIPSVGTRPNHDVPDRQVVLICLCLSLF